MSERIKRDILEAFNKLLQTEDVDKITVVKIIQEAKVSKATFYRCFIDKYDVMNYNYKLLLDSFSSSKKVKNIKDLYEQLYIYGRENWKTKQKAFATYGKNSFGEYIEIYSKNLIEKIVMHNRNGNGLTETEILQCDVFCNGIAFMYEKWIFDNYSLSAKEAAEALYRLTPETIRDLWW